MNISLPQLNIDHFKSEARHFVQALNSEPIPNLYGVTDGKAVGTEVELMFRRYLLQRYAFEPGNAALGIDYPELNVDLKVTSIRQPQSSSPFRDASQKVYGLGYHLLVLVYEKTDDPTTQAANLHFHHVLFIAREWTSDYQTTYGISGILERNGNKDDIIAFLEERNLPLDEIGRESLAERIMQEPPRIGLITISNALQWRLQYGRAIKLSLEDQPAGLENLLG